MRVVVRFLAALGLMLTLATAVAAQAELTVDMDAWETLSSETTELLADDTLDTVTDQALEARREQIVDYREEFAEASNLNAGRIAALREQIAALGAPPEGDAAGPEAPDVAAKREELNEQLNRLLAPVQTAEAAYLEADALVQQIDREMRDRQTRALLTLSPSPLNPLYWGPALQTLGQSFAVITIDAEDEVQDADWQSLRGNAPVVLILAAIGLVLIFRGRDWSEAIVNRLRRYGARGMGIWGFVVSLLRIVLPFFGLLALVVAGRATGYAGPRGNELLTLIPILGGTMLGFRWVAERVFSRQDEDSLLALDARARKKARLSVTIITLAIVLDELFETMLGFVDAEESTRVVIAFPIAVIIGLGLFRLGKIMRGYTDQTADGVAPEEASVSNLSRAVRGIGTGAIAVAVIAPLLMAAGYFNAGQALLQPYVISLAIFGLLMALQRFLSDVYGAVTGQGAQAREALMPVLFGLILTLLAAPFLALTWGARLTDLTELWAAFSRGFAIGDSRISPTDFLTFALIFVIGYVLTRVLQGTLRSNVLPKTKIDIGGQNAIVSGLGYVGIFLAALLAITGAGIDLSSLAIVAGALSVGIGFGLQNIVSNFVSGIILLIERPISEGDWIEVGGQMGYVRDISVRSTRIETFDRTDVIVPNADLVSGTVTNYTRGNTVGRLIVSVGVAYGTDTRRVSELLLKIAEAQPMVLASPPPAVVFQNFGADALEFEIRAILRDVNFLIPVKNEINHQINECFAKEGIEIPFAQRDVWLRNPEALKGPEST